MDQMCGIYMFHHLQHLPEEQILENIHLLSVRKMVYIDLEFLVFTKFADALCLFIAQHAAESLDSKVYAADLLFEESREERCSFCSIPNVSFHSYDCVQESRDFERAYSTDGLLHRGSGGSGDMLYRIPSTADTRA